MELIYILTYDCNFRCSYCDIDKREEDISTKVLEDSISFLKVNNFDITKVKFFGGEPLIKKKDIKYIINNFPYKNKANFYITSNSTLIDKSFISFVKEVNIKLTFSIDGDNETTSENRLLVNGNNLSNIIINNTKEYCDLVRINQVITSKNSKNFFKNFKFIYDLGVRKFNFLPEYYREWSKIGLKNLNKGFKQIQDFYDDGNSFYIVNLENYSDTSFFNLGLVIDTDGKIYCTNLILSKVFEKYKVKLCIGDVNSGLKVDINNDSFRYEYIKKIHLYISKEYSLNIINSVYYVDLILSKFVEKFK